MEKDFLVVLGKKKSGVKRLARELLRALLIRVTWPQWQDNKMIRVQSS